MEKKLGLIACRNRRLYLIAQKKIMDCLFEAEFELLEHEANLIQIMFLSYFNSNSYKISPFLVWLSSMTINIKSCNLQMSCE